MPHLQTIQKRHLCLVALVAFFVSGAVHAQGLTLAQCDRVTHISHGGESDQVDLGAGRVMWIDWWSQEGTAKDVTVMDCDSGQLLNFRAAEVNMTQGRSPFDRLDAALAVIDQHEQGARVFATFDRMAADLDRIVRDINVSTSRAESCACAALYPDLRGDKTPFDLVAQSAGPFITAKP